MRLSWVIRFLHGIFLKCAQVCSPSINYAWMCSCIVQMVAGHWKWLNWMIEYKEEKKVHVELSEIIIIIYLNRAVQHYHVRKCQMGINNKLVNYYHFFPCSCSSLFHRIIQQRLCYSFPRKKTINTRNWFCLVVWNVYQQSIFVHLTTINQSFALKLSQSRS